MYEDLGALWDVLAVGRCVFVRVYAGLLGRHTTCVARLFRQMASYAAQRAQQGALPPDRQIKCAANYLSLWLYGGVHKKFIILCKIIYGRIKCAVQSPRRFVSQLEF